MTRITVLYDEACPLCIRSARWLETQEAFIPVECLAAGGMQAHRRYGDLLVAGKKELTVVDDRGGVYRGTDAWLIALFALVEYREWAMRFSAPSLKPLARMMFETLSANRRRISGLLWADEVTVRENLQREHAAARNGAPDCDEGACDILDALPVR